MIVCQCRRITDRDVRSAMDRGAADLAGVARECGAGTECRGCHANLEALLAERSFDVPAASDPRRLAVIAA
jgi:bacterioferritin-associated ferredoxin